MPMSGRRTSRGVRTIEDAVDSEFECARGGPCGRASNPTSPYGLGFSASAGTGLLVSVPVHRGLSRDVVSTVDRMAFRSSQPMSIVTADRAVARREPEPQAATTAVTIRDLRREYDNREVVR